MKLIRRSSLFLAASLSALAGYIDALGFLYLGGYFVSFMSGNSTRLAVKIVEGDQQTVWLLCEIIGSFIVGSMLGAFIGHLAGLRRRFLVLLAVSLLLAAAAISAKCELPEAAVICMVLAMGAENAIFHRDGHVVIGLTYMTGTLVKIGQQLAASILGLEKRGWLQPLILWLGLMVGGVVGAVTYGQIGLSGLWFAVIVAFFLALTSIKHEHGVGTHL